MPIDYQGFVAGLDEVSTLVGQKPELVAVDALVTTLREATGAAGGTFTEYGEGGGRVVVAQRAMAWALGQPVPPELMRPEVISTPFSGWVESMPPAAAEPLLARGVVAVAGHPVWLGARPAGAVHLYFSDPAAPVGRPAAWKPDWPELASVLRVAAGFAGCIYTGSEASPVRSADEEDDRSLFLAVAGHELRTPVTVIKGYAGLLADRWDSLNDEQRRAAANVLTQRADELALLVDRLLRSSIGDTDGGGLVRQVPFDPVDVLVRTAAAMPAEIRRTIRLDLPNWLPPASGDPDVIATVVTELMTNAVRASEGGGESQPSNVDINAGADTDTVYIRVLDRGVGIEPAEVERAFERFWRGARPSAVGEHDLRGGVGLGLYLVRRLVERQNGWVSLRPRDGGGTVAEVRLARADGPPRPAGPSDHGRPVDRPGHADRTEGA